MDSKMASLDPSGRANSAHMQEILKLQKQEVLLTHYFVLLRYKNAL
jgi:hypothetical protein